MLAYDPSRANYPSGHLGLVTRDGALEYYDGLLHAVDSQGQRTLNDVHSDRYLDDFADRARQAAGFRGPIEYRYQLQVEDAELISRVPQVVFVDACAESLPGGYEWRACRPVGHFEFSTHALEPDPSPPAVGTGLWPIDLEKIIQ